LVPQIRRHEEEHRPRPCGVADAACILHHNGDGLTAVPVLLAGTAADGDLWPRLLRRQLLPACPAAPSAMKEHPYFLMRPLHR
ncbi:unnamed protein product, partial [Urochloa humidicola]